MSVFQFGDCQFNSQTRSLTKPDIDIELKPKSADVLSYLLSKPNEVVTKEELLEHVWSDANVSEGSLTKTMTELRQALGDSARNPLYIKTVMKKGYIWIHPSTKIETASTQETPEPQAPPAKEEVLQTQSAAKSSPIPTQAPQKKRLPLIIVAALVLFSVGYLINKQFEEAPLQASEASVETRTYLPKVAILPFQTGTTEDLVWLQIGLRDLICKELEDIGGLDIIPLGDLEKAAPDKSKIQPYTQDFVRNIKETFSPSYTLQAQIIRDEAGYQLTFIVTDLEGMRSQHVIQATSLGELSKLTSYAIARKMNARVNQPNEEDPNSFAMQSYAQGMHFFENHEYKKATHHFIVSLDNEPTMAWARFQMARARYNLDEMREAGLLFSLVTEEARLQGNPILEAKALRYHALVDRHLTNWPQAISNTEMALQLYQKLDHLSGVVSSQNQLATIHAQKGELEQASQLLDQSRQLIDQLGNPFVSSQTLIKYGTVLSMKGKLQEANQVFSEALQIVQKQNDIRNEAAILNNLGNIANLRNQYSEASQHYQEALKGFQKLENKNGQARTLLNLGVIAANLENHGQSDAYYRQALPIAQAVGNRFLENVITLSLGANAYKFDRQQEAKEWLIKGLGLAGQLGATSQAVDANSLLARVHIKEGDLNKADIRLKNVHETNNALYQTSLACLHFARSEFDQAVSTQSEAKKLAGERWSKMDEAFLDAYKRSATQKSALKLPSSNYLPNF